MTTPTIREPLDGAPCALPGWVVHACGLRVYRNRDDYQFRPRDVLWCGPCDRADAAWTWQADPADVLAEIAAERARQDAKWGEQNHPDLDPRDIDVVARHQYAFQARCWTDHNAERARPTVSGGRCTGHPVEPHTHTAWDGVLLEEVYEALAEADLAKLRAELVQVAAVAVAWIEAIDRRPAVERAGEEA